MYALATSSCCLRSVCGQTAAGSWIFNSYRATRDCDRPLIIYTPCNSPSRLKGYFVLTTTTVGGCTCIFDSYRVAGDCDRPLIRKADKTLITFGRLSSRVNYNLTPWDRTPH